MRGKYRFAKILMGSENGQNGAFSLQTSPFQLLDICQEKRARKSLGFIYMISIVNVIYTLNPYIYLRAKNIDNK